MPRKSRERHNDEFRQVWESSVRSRQWAADALDVSLDTVIAWLKPATSKSSNPAPKWAVDLLRVRIKDAETKEAEGRYPVS